MFQRLFMSHPRAVGESYGQHFGTALSFAGPLLLAGLACLVHAFAPGLFERTASATVDELHARMVRSGRGGPRPELVRPDPKLLAG